MHKYVPLILNRGITVDVIGVDMDGDHVLATKVANYRRADDPASLEKAIAETFAETPNGDSQDYDIIASIPDEVATAALKALSESGNYPIGEDPPKPKLDDQGHVMLDAQGQVVMEQPESGMSFGLIALLVMLVVAAVLFLICLACSN